MKRLYPFHYFFAIASSVAILYMVPAGNLAAQANNDPSLIRRQETLLSRRSDLQQLIQQAEQKHHQLDISRKDKLEELDELYRARASLRQGQASSDALTDEIVQETRNLRIIERQRADCLEELDDLYVSLSQLNHAIADCNTEIR